MSEEIRLVQCARVEDPERRAKYSLPDGYSLYEVAGEWTGLPGRVARIMMVIMPQPEESNGAARPVEDQALDALANWIHRFCNGEIAESVLFPAQGV